ncbi:MAG: hypothetical protein JW937_10250 [Candidatus Omnitrophica bacterium]|nr:hypothetical protein [Candidatus Omnitrophota bacterium]
MIRSYRTVRRIWGILESEVRKHPSLLLPFLIVGLADGILLTLIYLAPQAPVSTVLAPVVRAFFGEAYLHYPANFVVIPKMYGVGYSVISATLGLLLTATAILMLRDSHSERLPHPWKSFTESIRIYVPLFALWIFHFLLINGIFKFGGLLASKLVGHLWARNLPGGVATMQTGIFWISVFVALVFESAMIYFIPTYLYGDRRFLPSVGRALQSARRLWLPTLLLVVLPTFLLFPVFQLRRNLVLLMNHTVPETMLWVHAASLILTVVVDFVVVMSAALLLLVARDAGEQG